MPLHHSPIYQSLLHDLLNLKSNHVEISGADHSQNNNNGKKQRVFLDHENDEFWRINAQQPFPKVHEYHTTMLSWYTKRYDEIQNKGGHSISPSASNEFEEEKKNDMESEHDALKSTIRSMPQLLAKKKEIDRHQQLMKAISDVLSERTISEYFHLEEALMHSKILNSEQFKSLRDQLSSTTAGTVEDKLRLFLIYYLCHHDVTRSTLHELVSKLLTNDGMAKYAVDKKLKALQYVVEHKKLLNLGDSLKEAEEEKVDSKKAASSGFGVSSLFGKAGTFVATVRGMLPTSGNCTVTRIVKLLTNTDVLSSSVNILSASQTNPHLKDINKNYATFDPLMANHGQKGQNLEKINFQQYDRSIVFVVGGGCYSEYSNLMEFARNKQKDIIYGATDLVTPNDFLKQLSNLGS